MAQQDNPYLTITLTDRPPVKIKKEDWPVIASAEEKDWDNQYEFQSNRHATWRITARQHKDGRTIVYAIHTYTSQHQGEGDRYVRGGEIVTTAPNATEDCVGDTDPIVEAIQRVGEEIESRLPDDNYGKGTFPRLIHECIADLPAVEL